jgi:hypothetical protein
MRRTTGNAYTASVGKPERKRPFGRTRSRRKEIIVLIINK